MRGPIPFLFENMWLKAEGFKDLVKTWWWGFSFNGSSSYNLVKKVRAQRSFW